MMTTSQPPLSSLEEILSLFRPKDQLAVALATGQPISLLNALADRKDWERLDLFLGLSVFPYPLLMDPRTHTTCGYYGPIERMLNDNGAHMNYLPANFGAFESYAERVKHRVIAAVVSEPDAKGYVTFGTHGAAIDRPFRSALRDSNRVAIAEMSSSMPIIYGVPEHGDNKIHIGELNHIYASSLPQIEPPAIDITPVEQKIAEAVLSLIDSGATLQLGIGPVPNHLACLLAKSSIGNLGIHSELISDGFLQLMEAGKISNRHKGNFPNQSIFTFAFGSQALYDFLDERKGRNKRSAVCLPVSIVNDPHVIAKNPTMISVNSGLMIDFNGQVCSEAIGLRQYSGVGGQLSFVQGAYEAEKGKTIICLKSTASVSGKTVSNILPTLPLGSIVTTPRHYVQYIVTEYGVVNLYGVPDEERGEKLISIAHPDFRDSLKEEYDRMKKEFYKN